MCQQEALIQTGQSFELRTLFPELTRYCRGALGKRGCIRPEQCSVEVVVDYIVGSLSKKNRCEITDHDIVIRFPNAIDQKKVLRHMLWLQLQNKKSRCKDCNGLVCPLSDIFIEPLTPEEIFERKEILDFILSRIRPKARSAIISIFLYGETYEQSAKRFHVAAAALRKTVSRELKRLRPEVKRLLAPTEPPENVTRISSKTNQHQQSDTIGDLPKQRRSA